MFCHKSRSEDSWSGFREVAHNSQRGCSCSSWSEAMLEAGWTGFSNTAFLYGLLGFTHQYLI